jgi:probable F420-dependent oxidoreductase
LELSPLGIWSHELRYFDRAEAAEAAAELEELGYGALWIPGGAGGPVFEDASSLLRATQRCVVAVGILNIWMHGPAEAASGHRSVASAHPGRFLLGLGVSHAALVDSPQRTYGRPLQKMSHYLDELDAASPPVGQDERVLAALGPQMLAVARDRSAGAHPYLVLPEHTRRAREILGPRPLLAPEQPVLLDTHPDTARETARAHLEIYLQLPNYSRNLRRLGFSEQDLSQGGSDRLVDSVVCWGDEDSVARRVREHLEAGADHVCLQVLGAPRGAMPREQWRALPGVAG